MVLPPMSDTLIGDQDSTRKLFSYVLFKATINERYETGRPKFTHEAVAKRVPCLSC